MRLVKMLSGCRAVTFGLLIAAAIIVLTAAGTSCKQDKSIRIDRAISLRVLQNRAREQLAKGAISDDVQFMCNVRKLHGYIVDTLKNDVILLGQTEIESSRLSLDDLVVALRNIWGRYDSVAGNVRYYSSPGCSTVPGLPASMMLWWEGRIWRPIGIVFRTKNST